MFFTSRPAGPDPLQDRGNVQNNYLPKLEPGGLQREVAAHKRGYSQIF